MSKIYALRGITHGWGRLITVMGPAGDAAVRAAIAAHGEALADVAVVATAGNLTQYHARREGALERLIEAAGIIELTREQWDAQKAALAEDQKAALAEDQKAAMAEEQQE